MTNPNEDPREDPRLGSQESEEPAPIRCEEARQAVARFLGSGFKIGRDAKLQAAMRAHLQVCDTCAEEYRTSVETKAALTGAMRSKERRDVQKKMRPNPRPRLGGMGAMSVLFAMRRNPPSNAIVQVIWRLRPVVIASFFIFLMLQVSKPPKPGPAFRVDWHAGTIVLNGKNLRDTQPNFGMPRGVELVTKADGEARVHHGDNELLMHENSGLLAEHVTPARLRLVYGEIEIEGSFEITSTAGHLKLTEGRARITLLAAGLTVECMEGVVEVVSASVGANLQPGDVMRLDTAGMKLPIRSNPEEQQAAPGGAG